MMMLMPASSYPCFSILTSLPVMKTFSLLLGLLLVVSVPAPAVARTIDWGNAVGDSLVSSTGAALDNGFTFELGSFGTFIPTQFNLEDWAANWKVFDRAQTPNDWNSALGFFNSTATLEEGGVSSEAPPLSPFIFEEDEQAYIWVYNTQTMAFGYTEWALLTDADGWTFPAPGGKTDLPLEWRVSTADTLIYGGLQGVQGPGGYTADPLGYEIQTHSVVPEPSGLMLVFAAGALRVLRRRRL